MDVTKIADAYVDIGAKTGKLDKGLAGVRQRLTHMGRGMASLARTGAMMFAAMAAASGVVVNAYAKQEDSEIALRSALRNTGQEVDNNFSKFSKLAAQMQKTIAVGDEEIMMMMSQATNLGITSDGLEEATKGAIGLSKALGIDMQGAIRYTALALQGEYTILQRYIPALRQTTDEGEKMAIVQRMMASGYKQAEERAKGLTGQFKKLRDSFGDVLEKIGKMMVDLVSLGGGVDALRKRIEKIPGAIQEFIDVFVLGSLNMRIKWIDLMIAMKITWAKTTGFIAKGFLIIAEKGSEAFIKLKKGYLAMQVGFSNIMSKIIKPFSKKWAKAFSDSAKNIEKEMREIKTEFKGLADLQGKVINRRIKGIEKAGEKEKNIMKGLREAYLKSMTERKTKELLIDNDTKDKIIKNEKEITKEKEKERKIQAGQFLGLVEIWKKAVGIGAQEKTKIKKPGIVIEDKTPGSPWAKRMKERLMGGFLKPSKEDVTIQKEIAKETGKIVVELAKTNKALAGELNVKLGLAPTS